ncbi:MAG: hypothetical protein MUD12_10175 [Spirochaetes bacterium]|jgi:hypothetical protein|nr:hypothetical protein [Spirochaetota bacterium]
MAPDLTNLIRINARMGINGIFKKIGSGTVINAKILERLDGNHAILDVAGKRIRVEFTTGVPEGTQARIRYEGASGGTYIFKLLKFPDRETAISKFEAFFMMQPDEIIRLHHPDLIRLMERRISGFYELNSEIIRMAGMRMKKTKSPSRLMNSLVRLGLGREHAAVLSEIICGLKGGAVFLPLIDFLGYGSGFSGKKRQNEDKDMESDIGEALESVEKIDAHHPDMRIMEELSGVLTQSEFSDGGLLYGEYAYYDGDEFRPIKYMSHGGSWSVSVEFSGLGQVDILAKNAGKKANMTICCEPGRPFELLNENIKDLYSAVKGAVLNIKVISRRQFEEGLSDMIEFAAGNTGLDIRA